MRSDLTVPEIDALERLMKEWEVKRADCTPMEKLGFHRLKKKGHVRIKKGTYLMPCDLTDEEFDAWFFWLEDVLELAPREGPLEVGSGHPDG
jgi:hypothetical protein|tara:strand:- start:10414 stop:10689 length:276 start_codon:yes stop_codon:yes gene_type:complete